jgi:hypothetical protein
MTGRRIPKQGEVWTWNGRPRTVWAVGGDRVAVEFEDGYRFIATVDNFTDTYTPPELTVKESIPYHVKDDGRFIFGNLPSATHRIEVLTDGTHRLVEVDG